MTDIVNYSMLLDRLRSCLLGYAWSPYLGVD
jgi:hypothetical protein